MFEIYVKISNFLIHILQKTVALKSFADKEKVSTKVLPFIILLFSFLIKKMECQFETKNMKKM